MTTETPSKSRRLLPSVPKEAEVEVSAKAVLNKQVSRKTGSSPSMPKSKSVVSPAIVKSSGPKLDQGRTPLRYLQVSGEKNKRTPLSAPGRTKTTNRASPATPKRISHKPPMASKGNKERPLKNGDAKKGSKEDKTTVVPTARIEPLQLFSSTNTRQRGEKGVKNSPKPVAEVKPSSRVSLNAHQEPESNGTADSSKSNQEECIEVIGMNPIISVVNDEVLSSISEVDSETESMYSQSGSEDFQTSRRESEDSHGVPDDKEHEFIQTKMSDFEHSLQSRYSSDANDSSSKTDEENNHLQKDDKLSEEHASRHQDNIMRRAEEYLTPGSARQLIAVELDNCCVRVAVRVRPFTAKEKEDDKISSVVKMDENEVTLLGPGNSTHTFTYDKCLWSFNADDSTFMNQEDVFQEMGESLLDNAIEGFNTCLFAYGQTGSGKSYTIMGYQDEHAGIVPRFCKDLFRRIEAPGNVTFTVEVSFFEIYNERIHDLLAFSKENRKQLKVREHPETGPYVQDLALFVVRSYEDVMNWLEVGNKNRATAATGMNDKSSRSHSIFTLLLTQTQIQYFEETETQLNKTSKINLIDLAGSERASNVINEDIGMDSQTANTRLKVDPNALLSVREVGSRKAIGNTGHRYKHNEQRLESNEREIQEGGCINKSLHTLGKVISVLSDKEKQRKRRVHIPYRDSVLTWLLKESLGGNSKTAMIATISPASCHYGETLSTLRYAQQARRIVNHTKVNEDPNARLIRELLAEIERLRQSAGSSPKSEAAANLAEADILRRKLRETQMVLSESMRTWHENLESAERRREEESNWIGRRSGVALRVDNQLPNLVNLNEDPQLSEVLLYMLKEGDTSIGTASPRNEHDIQLNSTLVADKHCNITNEGDFIFLTPSGDAPTYVNGIQITDKCELHHGDRIVIGGDHFFRLNHPKEVQKLKINGKAALDKAKKDFEFARNEFLKFQNARLEAELEDAKIKAQTELMERIKSAKEEAQKEIKSQRGAFEEQLGALQMQLTDTESKKQEAEYGQICAEEKISRLKEHQKALEEEIYNNRKRLQMEALAAKQALEETKLNRIRILSALESEEKKLKEGVEKMKQLKAQRRQSLNSVMNSAGEQNTKVDLLRTSLMLREANKISEKLQKSMVFCRDDLLVDDKVEVRIRIDKVKDGLSTFWTLQKFEEKLNRFREFHSSISNGEALGEDQTDPFDEQDEEYVPSMRISSPDIRTRSGARLSLGAKRNSISLLNKLNESIAEESENAENSELKDKQVKVEAMFAKHRSSLEQEESVKRKDDIIDKKENNSQKDEEDTNQSSEKTVNAKKKKAKGEANEKPNSNNDKKVDVEAVDLCSFFQKLQEEQEEELDLSICSSILRQLASLFTFTAKSKAKSKDSVLSAAVLESQHLFSIQGKIQAWQSVHTSFANDILLKATSELLLHLKKLRREFLAIFEAKAKKSSLNDWVCVRAEIEVISSLLGKMSLGAVDHINKTDENILPPSILPQEILTRFIEGQNQFLTKYLENSTETVEQPVSIVRSFQLSQDHELDNDLIDDVMNLLISASTLMQRSGDFLLSFTESRPKDKVPTWSLTRSMRGLVSSVSTFCSAITKIGSTLTDLAQKKDELETMMEIAVGSCDATKQLAKDGMSLKNHLLYNTLDKEIRTSVGECFQRMEFSSKAVRVAATVLIQNIEKRLEVSEEQSFAQCADDEAYDVDVNESFCPLISRQLNTSSRLTFNMRRKSRLSMMQQSTMSDLYSPNS